LRAWIFEEMDVAGVFNKMMLKAGVVSGRALRGRKVSVPLLLFVAVCFVGGFASLAHSQPVHDLASVFNSELG